MLVAVVVVGLLFQQRAAVAPATGVDFSGRWTLVVALPLDADTLTTLTVRQSIRHTDLRGKPMTPYYDQIAIDSKSRTGMHSDTFIIGISGRTVGRGVSSTSARISGRSTHQAVTLSDEENARLWAEEAERRDVAWDANLSIGRPADAVLRDARARLK